MAAYIAAHLKEKTWQRPFSWQQIRFLIFVKNKNKINIDKNTKIDCKNIHPRHFFIFLFFIYFFRRDTFPQMNMCTEAHSFYISLCFKCVCHTSSVFVAFWFGFSVEFRGQGGVCGVGWGGGSVR